jgi:hypothetical protein
MPRRSALKFRDAIEARAWITDPKGEPQDLRQKIGQAIVTYQASRPDTGRRAYLLEGAERLSKAARLAHSLLLKAESTRSYGASVRGDGILPKRLRRALQACTAWMTERLSLATAYLWFHKALDERGLRTDHELTPEVLGLLPSDAETPCPVWWLKDHDRLARAAANLQLFAFFLHREAHLQQREAGRPRDGNRAGLILEGRRLGATIRTLAQLLAGLRTDPPGLENHVSWVSPVLDEWYQVREEAWYRALKEAAKQDRTRRRKGGKPSRTI